MTALAAVFCPAVNAEPVLYSPTQFEYTARETVEGNDNKVEGYEGCYADLKSLAISARPLLPDKVTSNLLSAIDAVIVGTPSNGSERTGGGISTYYPYSGSFYGEYAAQNSAFDNQKKFYQMIIDRSRYVSRESTSSASIKGGSTFNVAALHNHPVTADNVNKEILVELTSKELESVSKVTGMIVQNVDEPGSEYGEASRILGVNYWR